ncbi:hypothetical protein [Paenibacillus sp. y28]|uniref:hypothetical protein n=1 Tax=Paenibacillus sp. y28 TaxID=3129110 RepID=UPI0030174518
MSNEEISQSTLKGVQKIQSNLSGLQRDVNQISKQIQTLNNLQIMSSSITSLQNEVQYVSRQVETVGNYIVNVESEVKNTQARIDALAQEFQDFVKRDLLAKELQLAETRVLKIRQELEHRFGHYEEVRRRVTGILQAVDIRLVKKETIENASEEYMLAAPRYWLAPCLIALAAWLNDNRDLAERAMAEALRRDDEKTSLFFALVTRRAARFRASRDWLDRYFGMQEPHELEREIIVLIDGFTNGVFGPEARSKCARHFESWIEELSQDAGFVEEQRSNWKQALQAKIRHLDDNIYPHLKKYSDTWPQMETSLKEARLHETILDYFQAILFKEITPSKSIAVAVDALLDVLVSKFDDEEVPLRNEERLQALIIEENGDRAAAQNRLATEKTQDSKLSFTQLLTNFVMVPETFYASPATQKFSFALSRDWIRQAHDDFTAENRIAVPQQIAIQVDDWSGSTQNGEDEVLLMESLSTHMNHRRDAELAAAKIKFKHWFSLVVGGAFVYFGIQTTFLFIFALMAFMYFGFGLLFIQIAKKTITKDYELLLESCKDILRAVLTDVVDYRKEYHQADLSAIKVTELLEHISSEQYVYSSLDSARRVVQS